MKTLQWILPSPVGDLYLVASQTGLMGVHWEKQEVPMAKSLKESAILAQAVGELKEYFKGKRTHFDIPLQPEGTEFQKKVWKLLAKIPYGEAKSYLDIAKMLKSEKYSRAVGTANGKNPLSIIVPCHRVITSSGQLGGYAGGLEIKRKLLALEKISYRE